MITTESQDGNHNLAGLSTSITPLSSATTTTAAAEEATTGIIDSLSTNAVSRNLSNLHTPTWLALLSANITARTIIFHPIQLAISRKRVTREAKPPTVTALIKQSYHSSWSSGGGSVALGIRGCYRGLGVALLANIFGEISYLFTLEVIKERLGEFPMDGSSAGITSIDFNNNSNKFLTCSSGDTSHVFSANSWSAAAGAMCGDLVALLFVTPLVVVANRQMTAAYGMTSDNQYHSMRRTFSEVWNMHQVKTDAAAMEEGAGSKRIALAKLQRVKNGMRGIYQGTTSGLLRLPSSGCWWALYTKAKESLYTVAAPRLQRLAQERDTAPHTSSTSTISSSDVKPPPSRPLLWKMNWLLSPTDNPLLNALAGIAASVTTTLLFNPVVVIQTRQQTLSPEYWLGTAESGATAASSTHQQRSKQRYAWLRSRRPPSKRITYVAMDLMKKEGLRGFFKGASANVSIAVIDGIIFSQLFELTKLFSDTQFLDQL